MVVHQVLEPEPSLVPLEIHILPLCTGGDRGGGSSSPQSWLLGCVFSNSVSVKSSHDLEMIANTIRGSILRAEVGLVTVGLERWITG